MKLDWKAFLKIGASIFILYLCVYYWPWATHLFSAFFAAATPMILGCAITESTGIYSLVVALLLLFVKF